MNASLPFLTDGMTDEEKAKAIDAEIAKLEELAATFFTLRNRVNNHREQVLKRLTHVQREKAAMIGVVA